MLKNKDIICISSIDWDFVWQGHQEIMSTFSKNGNRILYIENTGVRFPRLRDATRILKRVINRFKCAMGFRKVNDNLYLYSPVLLPFPYSTWARRINHWLMISNLKRWLRLSEFEECIIWTFLPTQTALDIIENIPKKILVYYYIADFDQLVSNRKLLKATEEKLLPLCDVIFVQGEEFKKRCLPFNSNVHIFPFGVSTQSFEGLEMKLGAAQDLKDLRCSSKGPVIGYIGGIHRHIDFEIIRYIAENIPDCSIVMVGPIQASVDSIKNLKNIHFTGKKDFKELPSYISQFDIGIVPYLISEYTRTVYPTKINEYLIMGKPVVSSCLPEAEKVFSEPLMYVARSKEDFVNLIRRALQENSPQAEEKRKEHARLNGWAFRIEEMSLIIDETLERKGRGAPLAWHEKFGQWYRNSRRKIVSTSLVVVSLWGLLFYTPLIWKLASPLKLQDVAKPADAIVVFAGGVGEHGEVGKGYEERVSQAVKLYQDKLAPRIIFSSGSRGSFSETYVMKTLAMSLRVPEEAILTEDHAASTYENVKFTGRILNEYQWDHIVLVSSPYHMKRASLVFQKISPHVKIDYVPVENSSFYAHQHWKKDGSKWMKQASWEQMKALLHEYVAIGYYWWKGYI